MKGRRIFIVLAGILSLLILITIFTLIFIPVSLLEDIVVGQLAAQGYTFHAARFQKAFPLGVKAEGIELRNQNKDVLLMADRATVKPALLPLLTGKMVLTWKITTAGGFAAGDLNVRNRAWHLDVSGVKLEELSFLSTVAGVEAKGELHAKGYYTGGRAGDGELKLEVRDLDLKSVRVSGIALPDAGYDKVQGMITIKGGKGTLTSLNLQGTTLFVRLKGQLQFVTPMNASPLDLTLELMPKPEFLEEQKVVFLFLLKYLDSPGHYQIPLRGTLGHPAIQ